MLRRIEINDDQHENCPFEADYCESLAAGLLSGVRTLETFPTNAIIYYFEVLELARDRLSEILDKAEGK